MVRHTQIARSLVSLVVCALWLGFVGLIGPAPTVAAASSTYMDPMGAYSFTLPDGWQANDSALGPLFTRTDGTTLQIFASPSLGASLNDQIQASLPVFMQLPGYMPAGSGNVNDVTMGGQPAKAFAYYSNDLTSGKPLFDGIIAVTNKDTTYVLTFESTRENEHAFDADVMTIVTSWAFA